MPAPFPIPIDRSTPSGAEALLGLARRIDDLTQARARLAREVRAGWDGPARDRFDAERALRDAAASALAAGCRRLAGDLAAPAAA